MSYHKLRYHIMTATLGRAPFISPPVERLIHAALYQKAREEGGRTLQVGGMEDHLHVVTAIPPAVALADFVRAIKTASSRAVNRADLLDEKFHWQPGYGAFTADPSRLEPLLQYVKHQKQHHASNTLWPRLERYSR